MVAKLQVAKADLPTYIVGYQLIVLTTKQKIFATTTLQERVIWLIAPGLTSTPPTDGGTGIKRWYFNVKVVNYALSVSMLIALIGAGKIIEIISSTNEK